MRNVSPKTALLFMTVLLAGALLLLGGWWAARSEHAPAATAR